MSKYSGKAFELLPTAAVTKPLKPKYPGHSDQLSWEQFVSFEYNNFYALNYLITIYKECSTGVEDTKKRLKRFILPTFTLRHILIFIVLVICADPDKLKSTDMSTAKELLKLVDKYMIVHDIEDDIQIPTKDFIKEAAEEISNKYADDIREIVDKEFNDI